MTTDKTENTNTEPNEILNNQDGQQGTEPSLKDDGKKYHNLTETKERNPELVDELSDIENKIFKSYQNLDISKIIYKRLFGVYVAIILCVLVFFTNDVVFSDSFLLSDDLFKKSLFHFFLTFTLFYVLATLTKTHFEIRQKTLHNQIEHYTNKKREVELDNNYSKISKNNEEKNLEDDNKSKSLSQQKSVLTRHINGAKNALSQSLKSADDRIQEYNKNAKMIGRIALELIMLILSMIALIWYHYEKFIPLFNALNAWALTLFSFPILIVFSISITLFLHQKKLLDEVRHYSAEKRQIELYSGLLEASQYVAKSFNDPKESAGYVKETFDKIRDRILSEQSHTNTAGLAVEKEEYSSSLEPLIKVISDMIAKSEAKK